jgi:hypothetical protein
MLTSPFGMHFDEHVVNGHRVNHAVMYDASLIFLNAYPNPPSIRNGDVYLTFIPCVPVINTAPFEDQSPPAPSPSHEPVITTQPTSPTDADLDPSSTTSEIPATARRLDAHL